MSVCRPRLLGINRASKQPIPAANMLSCQDLQDLQCASVALCMHCAADIFDTCMSGLCRPILECSKQHLLKLDAVKEGPPGQLLVTDVGCMLTAMPMDIELGLSIIAAAKLGCSEELAIIASMATVAGSRVFARGQSPSASPFAGKSGDYIYIFLRV